MKIDILRYLDDKHLTIYRVAKEFGLWLHYPSQVI